MINIEGIITTQNLVPAGVATAGSAVEIPLTGDFNGLSVQTVGTYTGALSLQVTIDGKTWITVGGTALLRLSTGALSATIASAVQDIFSTNISGCVRARITALAAVTGSVTVDVSATAGQSMAGVGSPLPTGTNSIGTVILGAGTALVGQVSTGAVTTAPGTSQTTLNSAATTNATLVKATAGNVYAIFANNTTAADKFLRLYNKATAPTVGTDVPVRVITIKANSSKEIVMSLPLRFATGIGFAITNGAATLDNTVVAAGDVQLAIDWL